MKAFLQCRERLYHTIPVTFPISPWRPICFMLAFIMSHAPHQSATLCLLIQMKASIRAKAQRMTHVCMYACACMISHRGRLAGPPRASSLPLAIKPRPE